MFLAPFNYIRKFDQITCQHVVSPSAELLNSNMIDYWAYTSIFFSL